jgi:hypothetical protein
MKIEYQRGPVEDIQKPVYDLSELIQQWKDTYRQLYQYQIEEQVFFYRPINRKEWDQLMESNLSDMQKEEVICDCCILWPMEYDWDGCDAGVPTLLAKVIVKNSYLDSTEHRQQLTNFYRQEMFNLQNQITCIIHEAFPDINLETIENWDMETTAKYLSRAEWVLVNLRGAQMNFDPQQTQELQDPGAPKDPNVSKNGKERMTPEKLAELKAKYPEMAWGHVVTDASEMTDTVHTGAMALKTGF